MKHLPVNLDLDQLREALLWLLELYPNEVAGFVLDMRREFSDGDLSQLDARQLELVRQGLDSGYFLAKEHRGAVVLADLTPAVEARNQQEATDRQQVRARLAADDRWSTRMKPLRQAALADVAVG